jgi:hypothetical protein
MAQGYQLAEAVGGDQSRTRPIAPIPQNYILLPLKHPAPIAPLTIFLLTFSARLKLVHEFHLARCWQIRGGVHYLCVLGHGINPLVVSVRGCSPFCCVSGWDCAGSLSATF